MKRASESVLVIARPTLLFLSAVAIHGVSASHGSPRKTNNVLLAMTEGR